MPDRRAVDDLTIEELEEILAIRRAQARAARMDRLRAIGRLPQTSPSATAEGAGQEHGPPAGPAGEWASQRWGVALEPVGAPGRRKTFKSASRGRQLRERALLALEVIALLGLVVVLAWTMTSLKALNQEASQAFAQATAGPEAAAAAELLPGGHTPPDSLGGSVPIHLRDRVQGGAAVAVPIPTPGPQAPTRIVIPAIGVDAVVVEGDDWEQLKLGVGHHLQSANPGERGNLVLSAHNDIYGQIFRRLNALELEDAITVYAGEQPFTYRVRAKRIVEPTEVSVLAPTTKPVVTLVSCYPYLVDSHRIVVIGELD